jgi:hypothetical protein
MQPVLETEFRETGVIVGAPAQRPVKPAFRLFDLEIVNAGIAMSVEAVFVEQPVFISVGTKPVP